MRFRWALCASYLILLPLTVWSEPLISPSGPHIIVPKRGKLELRCYDNATTSSTPPRLRWYRDKSRKLDGEVQEGNVAFIKLSAVQLNHMGRYICVNNVTLEQSSIYVFVKDPDNAFLHIMVNNKLVREGDSCTIPCLVTDPEVTHLGLETCDTQPLPSGMSYQSDIQEGITINNIQREYDGCYICVGLLRGVKVMSSKYTLEVRLVPELRPVITVSQKDTVILRTGEQFELTCSSSNVNADVTLKWDFPSTAHPYETQTSHILSTGYGYERATSLLIPAVNQSDSGIYRCHANNEKGHSDEAVQLKVYDQGFIKMFVSQSPVQEEVKEGESLSLRIEFDAYPAPSFVSWSYNGKLLHNTTEHVITIHQQKYRYSSELKLVRVLGSEGGIYNFSASHEDASVHHSFHVYVNSKPVITAQEGPVDGQVRCIAAGYPVPKISWYFCELPHTRCSQLPNATQLETPEVTILSESTFGRSEVESRLNVTKEFSQYHTLECVASTEEAEAYTLFSISERVIPHKLFTPLLTGMVATGVLLSLVLVVLLYKYMQKPKFQIQWKVIESIHGNNHIYIDPTQLPYDSKWEFPRQKLRFGKTLGSGAFGKVVRATAYGLCSADAVTTVAVKMLKPNAHSTEKEALMSELKVLIYLGNHVNIVNLLGACTVGGPILVITEYCCYGDLLNFLRRKKESFLNSRVEDGYYRNVSNPTESTSEATGTGYMPMRPSEKERSSESDDIDDLSLDAEDLLSFSYQVAKGMEYITSRNCIHRDLAARNILLTHGRVAKICDFGLARDITTDASYVLRGNARLPVKWMSPESIFDCVYTIESDVWSYGILLWEIFSLGNSPYPGMQVGSAFYRMIQEGHRMSRPEFAPIEMYDMMLSCWNHDPLKRPSFKKLVERTELLLSENTKNVYLTLSNTSGPPEQQRVPSRRLSSVCSTTAPNQPLLQNTADVFLDYV
ncbi:KIT proto-oncogene, receptor tyrosine kinase b isoform X2 [Archocentrus centrarchus]|uniref:KIT proto-oncogene, receptor tyrosine kinase b isoform X2 n=1 Tax=Archocentrus centrarchus TaxID=63155 RepID=UPI0011E9F420|nr:mast/stem cell growth factor receptor kita-like isoform X2 [Archocentrus centrarchus]